MQPFPAARRPTALRRSLGAVVARFSRLRGQVHGVPELLLLARVVAVAAVVPLFVRLPLPRQAALLRTGTGKRRRPAPPDVIERVSRCVEVAQDVARPLVRRGCLTHAITLYWFLGRSDEEIELCFGLGHPGPSDGEAGEYLGHCWLTRGGRPFLERVDPTDSFGVVFRIPAVAPTLGIPRR